MQPQVEVSGVCKRIGDVQVLEDVTFRIEQQPEGQIVALLGPSGAGKTQLLRIIAGLEPPDRGFVAVGAGSPPVKPGSVGLVLQSYPLLRHRTVIENLDLAGTVGGMRRAEARARGLALLQRLRLSARAAYYPAQLSGGERQRVAIAQQLMKGKPLLLLDEPFSGLDRAALREVMSLLREIIRTRETETILVITHDVRAAMRIADRILLLGREHSLDPAGARVQARYDLREIGIAGAADPEDHPLFRSIEREIEGYFEAQWQVHGKFKLFAGALEPDGTLGPLADEVARFASGVAAKSIGAEGLAPGRILVSVGYRDDEPAYPVHISCIRLPGADEVETESAILAAAEHRAVLCHDIYATDSEQLLLVLMTLGE